MGGTSRAAGADNISLYNYTVEICLRTMIVSSISDGSGGLKPSTWYKHYGMDYNGASYCFITDADLVNPSSRELNAPHGRLIELVSTPVTLSKETFGIHFQRIYNNITTFPDLPI